MATSRNVILTAILFKGINQVKKEAKALADNLFCSEKYVKSIIREVEKNKITISKSY
jgi:MarR-like DNA-binding transcriptional regulator SgrR of sgrS sRNA